MSAWSNIEVTPQDKEIAVIDKFERTLENIPVQVHQTRELITRFEVCHFKYKQHLKNIKISIENLQPVVEPAQIGSRHFRNGQEVWQNDKTGRSLLGQQYVWALINWLENKPQKKVLKYYNENLEQQITTWLGKKSPDKEWLVRLLTARLCYDWKSYRKYKQAGKNKGLEYQTCRMDICHYDFPKHLDLLLQGIGDMKPVKDLEGCGSYNSAIKKCIEEEFSNLCGLIESKTLLTKKNTNPGKNEYFKLWLYACLAKTLREQTGLTISMPGLTE